MSAFNSNTKRKIEHRSKKCGHETSLLKVLFQLLPPVAAETVLGIVAMHSFDVVRRFPRNIEMMMGV